MAAIIHYNPLS